jgi:riboflavin kinase/FMN adenylyltransferase
MKLIDGIENIKKRPPYPVLTIGNFDGVHHGHQGIFQTLAKRAKERSGTSVVFTFEPHPLRIIAPERAPKLLTPFKEKVSLIKSHGIDILICANFTKEFALIKAEDFVKDILVGSIGVKEVFIGSNYLFGKGRKGSPELLRRLGKKYGFRVTVLNEIKLNNVTLSSSRIRLMIAKGKVEDASELLGRHYSVEGVVIEGAKRGKALLNVPTANIATSNELLPKDGVYAVAVDIGKKSFGGAANIGCNPTFRDKKFSFEVHILGLDRELLGETLRINFIKRIRDEIKFDNINDLALQMKKDIAYIKDILK